MGRITCFVLALIGAGVLGLSGAAHALLFTVSDISFTNLSGQGERLQWTVSAVATAPSVELGVGDSWTFTYGTFTFTNPINNPALGDLDDIFTASFLVSPPTPATAASRVGSPAGVNKGSTNVNTGWVNFNNTAIEVDFGNGGKYTVSFLDTTEALINVPLTLQATIQFISDSIFEEPPPGGQGPAPVPEPGTVILVGLGLAGLILGRKKLKS